MTKTLLRGGIVLTMEPGRRALDPGSVLFDDERILAVGSVEEVDSLPASAGAETVDVTGRVVMPGLHNTHLHSGLLRGTAESMSLWDWLKYHVDPAHKAMTPEIARAASELAYTEGVLAGTVSVLDMWRFLEGSAEVAGELGIRATLAPYVADLEPYTFFESLDSNRRLLEFVADRKDPLVRAWVGVEHWLYSTDAGIRDAVELARSAGTGFHTHSSESIFEVQESLTRFGRRPIEQFYNWGILGENAVVAHCVWLDDREIELLAKTGTSVAHCPCSNMKLSSGAAPLQRLRSAGVTVGLGTDGEKENNNLDLVEEMKFASLLQKVTTLDPSAGDPWDILEMATIEGARALGLASESGSLEVGKQADVITVDLRALHTTPILHGNDFNAAAHVVFSSSGRDVDNVWVAGRRIVADRALLTADVSTVRQRAQDAAEELFARVRALRRSGEVPVLPSAPEG
ncbi:amidohydrolase family protein [Streptomyces albipurpureus]|uniref:Amidohydrolase n=1 Tax=Streptomyces albipurpureus TaxID=2897419 RepID=A0ABT0UKM3_9ACTN|nr:amidohydrolase [Streptomyces sp. CWNU-1]MCM2388150.1 amidohydrolase [Streptomyces sp. CWNU-1]